MSAPGRRMRHAAFWLLLAATLAVYAAMVFWSLPRIATAAGGLLPFDLRPGGYSTEAALVFLDALDTEGRAFYLGPQHALDRVYPGLLALTLGWATLWAFRQTPVWLRGALVLPAVAGAIFDWIENARVAALLQAETVTGEAVRAASLATVAKSVAVTAAIATLLTGLGWRAWLRRRGRA